METGAERKIHWFISKEYPWEDWHDDVPYLNLDALLKRFGEKDKRIAQLRMLNKLYRAAYPRKGTFTAEEVEDALDGMGVLSDLKPKFDEMIE